MTDNIITDVQKIFKFLKTGNKKRKKKSSKNKTKGWLSTQLYK